MSFDLTKNLSVSGMKDLIGIKNHKVFWKRMDEMSNDEWTDDNGKICRPTKIQKNYSLFMPNQIKCVCLKYGIKLPE
jgi:hypothetical protein